MIAIFYTLKEELGGKELKSRNIISIETGPGKRAVERVAIKTFDSYSIERALIVGVGGGMKKELSVGDIVLCSPICAEEWRGPGGGRLGFESKPPISADENLLSSAAKLLTERRTKFSCGMNVTIPSYSWGLSNRGELLKKYPEIAVVDMEGYWVASLTKEKGIPFLMVRIVSDTINEAIPIEKLIKRIPLLGVSLRETFLLPFLQRL